MSNFKKLNKKEREKRVLFGLIDYFIETGEPVGSNSLQSAEFQDISPATIRNYFNVLEEEGHLTQLHASGGRIPTEQAYRLYAKEFYSHFQLSEKDKETIFQIEQSEMKEIAKYLQTSAETLSELTRCAVILSAPRFDHDFISEFKLAPIDTYRFLCIIVTDFGVIQTELLHSSQKLSAFSIKRIEGYFHWRLTCRDKPENLSNDEESLAQNFYNEIMMRYIIGYSTFVEEEVYRTGFSKLLHYADFHDTAILANSLALFENAHSMRLLLRDCSSRNALKCWIGDDLSHFATGKQACSVLTVPYKINQTAVGAIGLLGPIRMPYKRWFGLLRAFSEAISTALTRNIYKFKLTFRTPQPGVAYLNKEEHRLIGQSRLMLLEDKSATSSQAYRSVGPDRQLHRGPQGINKNPGPC